MQKGASAVNKVSGISGAAPAAGGRRASRKNMVDDRGWAVSAQDPQDPQLKEEPGERCTQKVMVPRPRWWMNPRLGGRYFRGQCYTQQYRSWVQEGGRGEDAWSFQTMYDPECDCRCCVRNSEDHEIYWEKDDAEIDKFAEQLRQAAIKQSSCNQAEVCNVKGQKVKSGEKCLLAPAPQVNQVNQSRTATQRRNERRTKTRRKWREQEVLGGDPGDDVRQKLEVQHDLDRQVAGEASRLQRLQCQEEHHGKGEEPRSGGAPRLQ